MRWLSYILPTADSAATPGSRLGLMVGGGESDHAGVIDVTARRPDLVDVSAWLQLDESERRTLGEQLANASADVAVDQIEFVACVPRPSKIFCIGVNYGGRNAEYADNSDEPDRPSVFMRVPESFTGHRRSLLRPPESEQLDYEGEIVAVIGRAGRRIPVERAGDHLAGLTLGNEGTIRDWVRHAKFNVTQGKNWESSGAMGPWLVDIDECGDLTNLALTTHVNGELRQSDTTATMRFPIAEQIHYLSTFVTLQPGDVIFTGTPTGAGARFDPPRWLVPGDVVEVSATGLGTLRNTVADEVVDEAVDELVVDVDDAGGS